MQLKQFYDIATIVSSKKSATTFGDLPDCWVCQSTFSRYYTWDDLLWHRAIVDEEFIIYFDCLIEPLSCNGKSD